MVRVLVTGASGFVGQTLCGVLAQSGCVVRAALRSPRPMPPAVAESVVVGDHDGKTRWDEALDQVDYVIHTAARVHILRDSPRNAELYIDTNARGTECLAAASAAAGVRRLVLLSSVKVNGESTRVGAFRSGDRPGPEDAYAQSKWLAESGLKEVSSRTGMEAVIVRPPLVYGPGVRANFLRLIRWVEAGWPLPLGAVHNRRSLVSVWNLCDLLVRVLEHPGAAGETFMVSDGEDLSTPDLIRRIGAAMGKRVVLPPVPVSMLLMGGRLLGRGAEVERLCGSLAVDISSTRERLDWTPPVTVDEAIARTVRWYLADGRSRAG